MVAYIVFSRVGNPWQKETALGYGFPASVYKSLAATGPPFLCWLDIYIPTIDRVKKNRLKRKCVLNPMFRIKLEQEHGTLPKTFISTKPTYPVKISISIVEPYKPIVRVELKTNNILTNSSEIGINQSKGAAVQPGMVWLASCL